MHNTKKTSQLKMHSTGKINTEAKFFISRYRKWEHYRRKRICISALLTTDLGGMREITVVTVAH